MSGERCVELRSIRKSYGATRAVDSASLSLVAGRVHAIVGENGAGKSTLLKIAGGVEVADQGEVLVLGRPLAPATPREAIARGVGMVHQHFMLVPTLTGLENLALGSEPTRAGLLDLRALRVDIERLASSLGLEVRLDDPVSALSVGERQRIELLRALRHAPKVLVLDEPTAVLAPAEARAVLGLARDLAARGVAVALVTHHLDEVTTFADEVTVLRRGRVVAHHAPGSDALRDVRRLAREALGEDVPSIVKQKGELRGVRLAVRDLVVELDEEAGAPLRGVSFDVRGGEIVGVAGVEGNGQRPLELAIAGLARATRGSILIDDREVTALAVRERRAGGLAWIPSDRHAHGIADLPARDVVRLGAIPTRGARVDEAALDAAFVEAVRTLDVRPEDPLLAATSFSGGNQQKLVVARELRPRAIAALLAAQPTRGVDLRAAARIRQSIVDAAREGAAAIVVSSDLDELREICDRILVLRGGKIAAELPSTATNDAIGQAMLG